MRQFRPFIFAVFTTLCIGNQIQAQDFSGLSSGNWEGIQNLHDLKLAFESSKSNSADQNVWVETDMRAHMNPTRMRQIEELAIKLIKRIATPCPNCNFPGWGKVEEERGLPCEYCNFPTSDVKYEIFGCIKCNYRFQKPRLDGEITAKRHNCSECNP